MDQKDKRRGQFYWFDEKPYVSVTNVLKVIDKPALRWWVGREVYLAMVKNPNLSEQEALSAPYQKKKAGGARGRTVHSLVEAWKKEGTKVETLPEEIRPYGQAFYQWLFDNSVKPLEHERTVCSHIHRYAGTLDLIVGKNSDKWLIDIKTGKDIYLESHLQLSAYLHALKTETGWNISRMGVVLLQESGKYKFEEVTDCFEVFLACKVLWEFLNREMCGKLGYPVFERDVVL